MLSAMVPVVGSQDSLCAVRHATKPIEDDEPFPPLGRHPLASHNGPAAMLVGGRLKRA